MMHTLTLTQVNLLNQPARERQPHYTLAERIASMDRSLAELAAAGLSWSGGYKALQAQRDTLATQEEGAA